MRKNTHKKKIMYICVVLMMLMCMISGKSYASNTKKGTGKVSVTTSVNSSNTRTTKDYGFPDNLDKIRTQIQKLKDHKIGVKHPRSMVLLE